MKIATIHNRGTFGELVNPIAATSAKLVDERGNEFEFRNHDGLNVVYINGRGITTQYLADMVKEFKV